MTSGFLQNKAPGFYRGVLGNSSYFKVHLCAHPRSSGFYPRSCTLNRGASFSLTCVQLLPGSWLFCLKNDPQNHLFSPLPPQRALFFLPFLTSLFLWAVPAAFLHLFLVSLCGSPKGGVLREGLGMPRLVGSSRAHIAPCLLF